MNRTWYLALPLLIGHGCVRSPSDEDLYRQSEALRRQGLNRQAVQIADQGWRHWQNRTTAEWHWKFRLLKAEVLLIQGARAQARELLRGTGDSPPRATELQARHLADLGFAERDRELLDQAAELASRGRYSSLLASIELKRASLDGYGSRREAFIRNALSLARSQKDAYLEAGALLDLGFLRLSLSRFDEAIPWLEQAESTAHRIQAEKMRERALGSLGWCYLRLGDLDRAIHSLSAAAMIARQLQDDDLRNWLNNIGNIHYVRSEFGQAITYYREAGDLARQANDDSLLTMTLDNLAATRLKTGDLAAAEHFNQQALELIQKNGNSRSLLHAQLNTARIEAARKQAQAESSFRVIIDSATRNREPFLLWQAQAGLAHYLRENGREPEADAEFRNALATIENEWAGLGQDRYKVTFLAQLITFYGDYVDFLVGRGEIHRAAAVADSSRARVMSEKVAQAPGAGRIEIRRRTAGPILLSYWLAPFRSHLWLIGPKGVSHFVLPGEAEIAVLARRYTAAIERGHDPLGKDNPAGRALFETLLGPARALIPRGASVIVVPDGCLHGLNFETLIAGDPAPHYWIEDVTVSVAPALGVLQSPPSRRVAPARLLFLGDPALADPAFPTLTHLKEEAQIIRRNFPGPSATLLTREAAHPAAYQAANPGEYSLIHFATHAVANAESPLNSAVILSDAGEGYKLYAKDVIVQRLQAHLVTISACRSAGAKSYAGEGLIGFTWAFLQAGARNVVAGLWNADDAATADIMAAFYEKLVSGARPAEALRFAKLKLVKQRGPHRMPYYWGTLQLFTRELDDRTD
jgi:CHAT domain-containing protein/tetratricopeptide (TPR) repeat protein